MFRQSSGAPKNNFTLKQAITYLQTSPDKFLAAWQDVSLSDHKTFFQLIISKMQNKPNHINLLTKFCLCTDKLEKNKKYHNDRFILWSGIIRDFYFPDQRGATSAVKIACDILNDAKINKKTFENLSEPEKLCLVKIFVKLDVQKHHTATAYLFQKFSEYMPSVYAERKLRDSNFSLSGEYKEFVIACHKNVEEIFYENQNNLNLALFRISILLNRITNEGELGINEYDQVSEAVKIAEIASTQIPEGMTTAITVMIKQLNAELAWLAEEPSTSDHKIALQRSESLQTTASSKFSFSGFTWDDEKPLARSSTEGTIASDSSVASEFNDAIDGIHECTLSRQASDNGLLPMLSNFNFEEYVNALCKFCSDEKFGMSLINHAYKQKPVIQNSSSSAQATKVKRQRISDFFPPSTTATTLSGQAAILNGRYT